MHIQREKERFTKTERDEILTKETNTNTNTNTRAHTEEKIHRQRERENTHKRYIEKRYAQSRTQR